MKALLYTILITSSLSTLANKSTDDCSGENCLPEINNQKNLEDFGETISKSVSAVIGNDICKNYKRFTSSGVPEDALKQVLTFYTKNSNKIKNPRYVSLADYSQNSKKKRYYLLDMVTGEVQKYQVSHGSGKVNGVTYGDPNHDGMIDSCKFSDAQLKKLNNPDVHERWAMTRPGFFITSSLANSTAHDPQFKKNGAWPMISEAPRLNKLLLSGLNKGVNDDAMRNGVVMHEAWYNTGDVMGRSFGCPAFKPNEGRVIMNQIKGGSLYYSYVPKCSDDMAEVEKSIPGWQNTCN